MQIYEKFGSIVESRAENGRDYFVRNLLFPLFITGVVSIEMPMAISYSSNLHTSVDRFKQSDRLCSQIESKDSCLLPHSLLEKINLYPNLFRQATDLLMPRWQTQYTQVPFLSANKITKTESENPSIKISESSKLPSEFPSVSRSSLILSSPHLQKIQNLSLLAHPAPETKTITSPYGWRRRPYSGQIQFHKGVDYGAPLGSPVVAANDGVVIKVVSGCFDFRNRWCGSQFGNWVEIDHGNGLVATYAHLRHNSITVKKGMKVKRNQKIAKVGSSGWSTGAHLDFRLKVNGEYQNPRNFVLSQKSGNPG
ncbi:MAG: M23 family metallopeptidase [Xenococcaceae cyanobacterium]